MFLLTVNARVQVVANKHVLWRYTYNVHMCGEVDNSAVVGA